MKKIFILTNTKLSLIAAIIIFFINFFLYQGAVPFLNISEFSNIGVISYDSYVFHNLANNIIRNDLNSIFTLFTPNFHVFFLIWIYKFGLPTFLYTLINSILLFFFTKIIFYITDIEIGKSKINQRFIIKTIFIIFIIFIPSSFFFYSQISKDYFIILAFLYIFQFLFIKEYIFLKKKYLNIFILFLSVHVLITGKDYLILTFLIFSFFYIAFFFNDRKKYFNKIILLCLIVIICLTIKYFLIGTFDINLVYYYNSVISNSNSDFLSFQKINFFHEYNSIFDRLVSPINKIRFFLINHSLENNASSLISTYYPSNFKQSLILYFKNIFPSIFMPFDFFDQNISLMRNIASSENLIYLVFLSSIFLNIKKKKYNYLLIIFFIFICTILYYINPNLGSYYKQKSFLFLTLLIFGLINWIKFFDIINQKYFINLNNKDNFNEISFLSSNSYKVLIFTIIFTLIILMRDVIIFHNTNNYSWIDLYLALIIYFSIISNSVNPPLNEMFIDSFHNKNKIYFLPIVAIFFLTFLVSLLVFYNNVAGKELRIYFITTIFLFLITLLLNSFFNSYLIYKSKYLKINLIQILSLLTSFLYLYICNDFNFLNIIISLNIWITINFVLNLILNSSHLRLILSNINFQLFKLTSINLFFNNYLANIFINGNLIILLFINTTTLFQDYYINLIVRIYLYLFGIIMIIFNIIISPYLIKSENIDKNKSNILSKYIDLVLVTLSILIVIFLTFIDLIFKFLFNLNNQNLINSLIHDMSFFLFSLPLVSLNYYFSKQLILIKNYKVSNYVNILSIILFLFLTIVNVKYSYLSLAINFFICTLVQFLIFNFYFKFKYFFNIKIIFLLYLAILILCFNFSFNINNYYYYFFLPISIIYLKLNFEKK